MDFNAEDDDSSVGLQSCAGWGCEGCEFYINFYDIMYKCEKCGKVNDGGYECKCEVVKE
jgi:hypothetical protein